MEGPRKYRLPTEAEWEYAARAGSRTRFSWGDDAECSKMMYENDVGSSENKCVGYVRSRGLTPDSTAPVKSYSPNAWGLYDMHGNVWEWCQDWYGNYPSGSVTDPTGPSSGSGRVLRGGGWSSGAGNCRSANRDGFGPRLPEPLPRVPACFFPRSVEQQQAGKEKGRSRTGTKWREGRTECRAGRMLPFLRPGYFRVLLELALTAWS